MRCLCRPPAERHACVKVLVHLFIWSFQNIDLENPPADWHIECTNVYLTRQVWQALEGRYMLACCIAYGLQREGPHQFDINHEPSGIIRCGLRVKFGALRVQGSLVWVSLLHHFTNSDHAWLHNISCSWACIYLCMLGALTSLVRWLPVRPLPF